MLESVVADVVTIKRNCSDSYLVFSDPHGQYDYVKEIFDTYQPNEHLRPIVAGDILDRGKKIVELFDLLISCGAYCVLGNHEAMFLSWMYKFVTTKLNFNLSLYNLDASEFDHLLELKAEIKISENMLAIVANRFGDFLSGYASAYRDNASKWIARVTSAKLVQMFEYFALQPVMLLVLGVSDDDSFAVVHADLPKKFCAPLNCKYLTANEINIALWNRAGEDKNFNTLSSQWRVYNGHSPNGVAVRYGGGVAPISNLDCAGYASGIFPFVLEKSGGSRSLGLAKDVDSEIVIDVVDGKYGKNSNYNEPPFLLRETIAQKQLDLAIAIPPIYGIFCPRYLHSIENLDEAKLFFTITPCVQTMLAEMERFLVFVRGRKLDTSNDYAVLSKFVELLREYFKPRDNIYQRMLAIYRANIWFNSLVFANAVKKLAIDVRYSCSQNLSSLAGGSGGSDEEESFVPLSNDSLHARKMLATHSFFVAAQESKMDRYYKPNCTFIDSEFAKVVKILVSAANGEFVRQSVVNHSDELHKRSVSC